jgi:hypothetical protein
VAGGGARSTADLPGPGWGLGPASTADARKLTPAEHLRPAHHKCERSRLVMPTIEASYANSCPPAVCRTSRHGRSHRRDDRSVSWRPPKR